MGLKEDFDQAAKDALTLPASTTNDDKLVLYGLFKTATVGKPETSRPGIFDQKGRAKWDAWKKVEDKSKDEAMQDYILKVTQLKEAWPDVCRFASPYVVCMCICVCAYVVRRRRLIWYYVFC